MVTMELSLVEGFDDTTVAVVHKDGGGTKLAGVFTNGTFAMAFDRCVRPCVS